MTWCPTKLSKSDFLKRDYPEFNPCKFRKFILNNPVVGIKKKIDRNEKLQFYMNNQTIEKDKYYQNLCYKLTMSQLTLCSKD